jgi:hypothetical protein
MCLFVRLSELAFNGCLVASRQRAFIHLAGAKRGSNTGAGS